MFHMFIATDSTMHVIPRKHFFKMSTYESKINNSMDVNS